MSTNNDGGPAFPRIDEMDKDARGGFTVSSTDGMTLRDYFAAKAMQAAATNVVGAEGFSFEERAKWAYVQADAMLAERAK